MFDKPYNPLEKKNLAASVSEALLARPISPLPPEEPFEGAGIYAIYYVGQFSTYESIAQKNRDGQFKLPIYVGKAVPAGSRKGGYGFYEASGKARYRRLCEHAETIRQAENLNIDDFFCRYLVVDDIWIPLGEALLIEWFYPVWNMVIDGFGNHDPGSGRYSGKRSRWDTIHPGRAWANRLKDNPESIEQIVDKVKEHKAKYEV